MKYLYIILLCVVATACSQAGDSIASAGDALSAGDFKSCQRQCDFILEDSAAFNQLNVSELCRLAELFVCIPADQESNDGAAVRCLSRARKLDTDSVDAFLAAITDERAVRLRILDCVGAYQEIPREKLVVIGDTIPADHDHGE